MGKSVRGKTKRRPQVVGIPTLSELEKQDELNGHDATESVIDSVLEKLQGSSAGERECGANILAQMSSNSQFLTQFIEKGGIRIVGPLLADRNSAVKLAACGSLRNMCAGGNQEICGQMISQDVMTPLSNLLNQYTNNWIPAECTSETIDSKKDTFLEACFLLNYLCEGSNVAIEAFNRNNLVFVLMPCLNVQKYGLDITSAVAQCLLTVTEDNQDAYSKVMPFENDMLTLLQLSSKEASYVYLKVLVAGVMLNLCSGNIRNCVLSTRKRIMCVIEEALDISIQQDVEKVSQMLCCPLEDSKDKFADVEEEKKNQSLVNERFIELQNVLTSKKVALEILTNIFTSEDDEEDWDDEDSSCGSDDITDSEDLARSIMLGLDISSDVREMVTERDIIHKVLNQIVIPPTEIVEVFQSNSEGKKFSDRLHTVRCRALFCINNLMGTFEIDEIGGKEELFKLWMDLSLLMFSRTDPSDLEQLQAATSSVRAVLQKLAETDVADHFTKVTKSDLKLFFDMWQKCSDSSIQVNIIRSVATIAFILTNPKQKTSNMIKDIGTFLIDVCLGSADLWTVAECLDAIFDVFAEDHMEAIASEIGLVSKLKLLEPNFKRKIKQQRKSLGDNYPVVTTAKTNLSRFLKYKENTVQ